jgi:hypothetical protein
MIQWGSFSQHYILDSRCKVQLQQESFGGYALLLTVVGENNKPEELTLKPHVSADSLLDMDGKKVDKVLRECEALALALTKAIKQSKETGASASYKHLAGARKEAEERARRAEQEMAAMQQQLKQLKEQQQEQRRQEARRDGGAPAGDDFESWYENQFEEEQGTAGGTGAPGTPRRRWNW